MYPILTLDDGTEIVHSETLADGRVRVYVERPNAESCFHHATCYLPGYVWQDIFGFFQTDIDRYQETIRSVEHRILQQSRKKA